jgi:hypothetical protein
VHPPRFHGRNLESAIFETRRWPLRADASSFHGGFHAAGVALAAYPVPMTSLSYVIRQGIAPRAILLADAYLYVHVGTWLHAEDTGQGNLDVLHDKRLASPN